MPRRPASFETTEAWQQSVSSHLLLRLTADEVNNPCKEINRKDELIRDIYGHLCKKRGMKKS